MSVLATLLSCDHDQGVSQLSHTYNGCHILWLHDCLLQPSLPISHKQTQAGKGLKWLLPIFLQGIHYVGPCIL